MDVLAFIAQGRDELKSMRGVSRAWEAGFSRSVIHLKISSSRLGAPMLGCLHRFPNLTSLNLGGCRMGEEALVHLRGLRKLSNLEIAVQPEDYNCPLAKRGHSPLALCFTGAGLKHIIGPPLTSLSLRFCRKLIEANLKHLQKLPLLSQLDLRQCEHLTDDGLELLKGVPLTDLDLSECRRLTDEGLEHLRDLPLTRLDLRGNREITDAGMSHLRKLPLTDLNLGGCTEITGDGFESLQEQRYGSHL